MHVGDSREQRSEQRSGSSPANARQFSSNIHYSLVQSEGCMLETPESRDQEALLLMQGNSAHTYILVQ